MKKVFEARYPTSNAGFVFLAISIFLSLATLAFFVIVIGNQHRPDEPGYGTFNWLLFALTVVISLLVFGLALAGVRRLLRNEPRRVTVGDDRIIIEKAPTPGGLTIQEVEIPFEQLLSVDQHDQMLASEAAKGGVRFKGLQLQWRPGDKPDPHFYLLSERDVRDFDALLDEVFERIPEKARGQRIFDR